MPKTLDKVVTPEGKLTPMGKKHSLVKSQELISGKKQAIKCIEEKPVNPAGILTLGNLHNREIKGELQDKIFETYEKMIAPLDVDIKKPFSTLVIPGVTDSFVDPLFFLKMAKLPPPPEVPSIPDIISQLSIDLATTIPALSIDPQGNTTANVALPPPPLMPPPVLSPTGTPATPGEISVCVGLRQVNFASKLGMSLEELLDNIPKLLDGFMEIKFASLPELPKLPEIFVDPILQPFQFEEQLKLSLGSITVSIKLIEDLGLNFVNPIKFANFLPKLGNPAELADELMKTACKSLSSTRPVDNVTQPAQKAAVDGATQTAAAAMVSVTSAHILGPGAFSDFVFQQTTRQEFENIQKRIASMELAYEIQERVSLDDAADRAKKRRGKPGTLRQEFIQIVNDILSQKTKYPIKGGKKIAGNDTHECLSAAADLINLDASGKTKGKGIKAYSNPAIVAGKPSSEAANLTAKQLTPYTHFMAPYHARKYGTAPELRKFIANTCLGWSSCAMTVRAIVMALRERFPNKGYGVGSYYTQPYNPVKANALGVISKGPAEDAKYKFQVNKEDVNKMLANIQPGDFFLIRNPQKNGTEHVAMWLSDTPPKLGVTTGDASIFEGGQADPAQPFYRGQELLKNDTLKKINGCRIGYNKWTFIIQGGRLKCQFLETLTGTKGTKDVVGVYNLEKFIIIPLNRKA